MNKTAPAQPNPTLPNPHPTNMTPPVHERRQSLIRLLKVATYPAVLSMVPLEAMAATPTRLQQPDRGDPEHFIERTFSLRDQALANGDQGFGAVVVKDQHIVGQAPSRVIVNQDPTAHAETEALRDAARRLGTRDLSGCVLYSSSQPCPMCEAAAYWARIDRLWFGNAITDGGVPRLGRC